MKRQPKGYYVRNNVEYTAPRKIAMQRMREEGRTFESIAKEFGISRQRVQQILSGK